MLLTPTRIFMTLPIELGPKSAAGPGLRTVTIPKEPLRQIRCGATDVCEPVQNKPTKLRAWRQPKPVQPACTMTTRAPVENEVVDVVFVDNARNAIDERPTIRKQSIPDKSRTCLKDGSCLPSTL